MSDRGSEPHQDDSALVRPFLAGDAGPQSAQSYDVGELDMLDAPVRPFLVTSGRTQGAENIPIEAQVVSTTVGRGARLGLSFEYRDIVNLCHEPLAVAEVAARLSLHLGVARVLIGDLQHQGLVTTFEAEADVSDDVETILRVINGLRQRT